MKRILTVILFLALAVFTAGCFDTDFPKTDTEDTNIAGNDNSIPLEVTSSLICEVDKLPSDASSAIMSGAPVGGNPAYFLFEEGLTYYRHDQFRDEYHKFELCLPKGYSEGNIIFVDSGAGSGEVLMVVQALNEGETVYLECLFYPDYSTDQTGNLVPYMCAPVSAEVGSEYKDMMKLIMSTHYMNIFRCDAVYRTQDTKTYGNGTVYLSCGDFILSDIQLLLCDDGCDTADIVSRAAQGYAPAYKVVKCEEFDGNYPTARFEMEIPDGMIEFLQEPGAYEEVTARIKRSYYYLLSLDETHYAYIHIEPRDTNPQRPADETETVNSIIREAVAELFNTKSALYSVTENYLEKEFRRVYDRYYEIQSLTISRWSETENEATFNYNMTFLYYNRDPDTVDYIIKAKQEDPERYKMMYDDYLAPKQVNYQFKTVLKEGGPELYFNVSPTGTEWVKTAVDDFVLGNDTPLIKRVDLTASYPCTEEEFPAKTEELILNHHRFSTILYSETFSYDNGNLLTAYAVQDSETLTYYQICYLFDSENGVLNEYAVEIGDLEALRKADSQNTVRNYFSGVDFVETRIYQE